MCRTIKPDGRCTENAWNWIFMNCRLHSVWIAFSCSAIILASLMLVSLIFTGENVVVLYGKLTLNVLDIFFKIYAFLSIQHPAILISHNQLKINRMAVKFLQNTICMWTIIIKSYAWVQIISISMFFECYSMGTQCAMTVIQSITWYSLHTTT